MDSSHSFLSLPILSLSIQVVANTSPSSSRVALSWKRRPAKESRPSRMCGIKYPNESLRQTHFTSCLTLQTRAQRSSTPHRTAMHKCMCGCGVEVVTPISPTDWRITFDGETVSLFPSIGNWSYPCRSHYWIESGIVVWAGDWSDEEIRTARDHERWRRQEYYGSLKDKNRSNTTNAEYVADRSNKNILKRFWNWIRGI